MTTSLTPTQFEDLQGTVWDASITIAAARRVDSVDYSALSSQRVTLLRPDEGLQGLFGELLTNTGFLFALLFDIMISQVGKLLDCDPYINRVKAEEEFSARMGGQQIVTARAALWRALEGFFPQHRTALQKSLSGYESGLQSIQEEIETLAPEVQELLMQQTKQEVSKIRERLLAEIRGEKPSVSPPLPVSVSPT